MRRLLSLLSAQAPKKGSWGTLPENERNLAVENRHFSPALLKYPHFEKLYALGKLGNTVAETSRFLYIVAETKFAS